MVNSKAYLGDRARPASAVVGNEVAGTEYWGNIVGISGTVIALAASRSHLARAATGSQRWGMSTVLVFFAIGFLLMLTVPNAGRGRRRG